MACIHLPYFVKFACSVTTSPATGSCEPIVVGGSEGIRAPGAAKQDGEGGKQIRTAIARWFDFVFVLVKFTCTQPNAICGEVRVRDRERMRATWRNRGKERYRRQICQAYCQTQQICRRREESSIVACLVLRGCASLLVILEA